MNTWTAQRPPADFPSRTVDAMLSAKRQPAALRLRGRGRFGPYLLLAAALVSSAAWAHLSPHSPWNADEAQAASAVAIPSLPTAILPMPRKIPAPPHIEIQSPPTVSQPAAPISARRLLPLAAASAAPTPPVVAPLPRCQCGPGAIVCACLD